MTSELITSQNEFDALAADICEAEWLAIDTEFIRESSYYPKLCLIQIATENVCTCIDVLALPQIDRLIDVLNNPACTKIFHSARQDLEVLYADYGMVPTPVFDTQIAASMLGPDEQISYAELVAQQLSVHLAKTESRTDWMRRPLTAAQIAYALDDVRYLGALYQQLANLLADKNRSNWLAEECDQLTLPDNYKVDPNDAWKNVKGVGKTQGAVLQRVQQLAHWRESHAQSSDRPRQWILKDRAILDLAYMQSHTPETVTDYLENEWPKSARHKNKIITVLKQVSQDESPAYPAPLTDRRLSKPQQALAKNMMQYIKQHAQEIGAAPSLLANRKSIENLVLGKTSKVMSGWRKSEIGGELTKMLSTETS